MYYYYLQDFFPMSKHRFDNNQKKKQKHNVSMELVDAYSGINFRGTKKYRRTTPPSRIKSDLDERKLRSCCSVIKIFPPQQKPFKNLNFFSSQYYFIYKPSNIELCNNIDKL